MKINKINALNLWNEIYGRETLVKDFHGNYMSRDAYGEENAYHLVWGQKVLCGWNIHHILPKAAGGTNEKSNLICTNIITNREAGDKTTFWIDDCNYQVQWIDGVRKIVMLNPVNNRLQSLSFISTINQMKGVAYGKAIVGFRQR
ncbi:MAG: HNH endonuclease [Oscillospiraceae bacterium]|jgi:hypothetical protein|nr:HNH endonuclease [Oscillospiraceae bacterium]